MAETNTVYRISSGVAIIMIAIALLCDLIGLIPLAEDILTPVFWICANLYMWKKGIPILNTKRLITQAVSAAIGFVPFIQWLPQITAGICAIIVLIRIEDMTGLSLMPKGAIKRVVGPKNANGVRQPNPSRPPLYENGTRNPENMVE